MYVDIVISVESRLTKVNRFVALNLKWNFKILIN